MHPIEHLRFVARAVGVPQDLLVRETASALAAFGGDPPGLVTACRRVISRHLAVGGLWTLCARMLHAADPLAEARVAVEELDADRTARHLAIELPPDATALMVGWSTTVIDSLVRRGDVTVLVAEIDAEAGSLAAHLDARCVDVVEVDGSSLGAAAATADVVLVEAELAGPAAVLAPRGTLAAACVAAHAGRAVWFVVPYGRAVGGRTWDAAIRRWRDRSNAWDRDLDEVPLDTATLVIGPTGAAPPTALVDRVDCPVAPELFKADVT
ncbi:MAG TPA: hypothetical protein PKD80_18540 [Microthrixaceae bacterium]|jgi:hypothetical protein|nr:hypothetical protein [Microthrixaceae bacterium]HMT25710.1 hypothetical protein [Microthrixaceae bacterium]HMT60318.1 hypothetical protein [Microthrixaceae bacterium]